MKTTRFLILALGAFAISCSDDSPSQAPLGSYDNGILVLNEGGTGEVTYVSDDLQTVQQNVFETVNGTSQNLGQYVQSIFFDGDRAFIIANGSNKITVVNRYTFEYLATIDDGLQVPRYGVVSNGKAYVTNANSFTSATDDFIAVIDLSTFAVEDPIPVNDQNERITAHDGMLYVSSGFFGTGNKINVFNAATKSFATSIIVGETPNSLEIKNDVLYVLCGNFADASRLVRIDTGTNAIIDEVTFPESMGNAQNLDIEGNSLYFTVGPEIHKIALNSSTVTDSPLVDTGSAGLYIGYGFGVNDGKIFISEAADDFSSDGVIFVYSTSGEELGEIPVGLGPNGFYFN